jgi:hypothetical protein
VSHKQETTQIRNQILQTTPLTPEQLLMRYSHSFCCCAEARNKSELRDLLGENSTVSVTALLTRWKVAFIVEAGFMHSTENAERGQQIDSHTVPIRLESVKCSFGRAS